MAKDKLTDYDSTASNNLDVGGISVAEGMLPSGVNNAIREQMSHLADFAAGTSGVDVLKLQDDTDTNSIKLQAPASVTTTTTFTLPDGDGASGQTMITDGAGTLSWAAPYGNRNLIINGAMQVAQRGTSYSSISSDQYTLDRFIAFHTSVTPTITQESLSVGQTDLPSRFRNYLRFTAGTGATLLGFCTRIEDVSKYYGTYKLSFYAKGTNPAGGSFQQRMIQRFGTGGSSQVITNNGTFTVTSSWQRFEIDVIVPSVSGKTIGAGSYLQLQFTQPDSDAGTSAWTLDITGIQLEVGSTATPFEHRSYGDELLACMRYYQQIGGESANVLCTGQCTSSTLATFFIPFIVPVRDDPTCSVSDQTHFRVFNAAVSGIPDTTNMTIAANVAASCNGFRILATVGSGLSAGNATMLYSDDSDNNAGIIKMDAEL